jgi:hypothetical protein
MGLQSVLKYTVKTSKLFALQASAYKGSKLRVNLNVFVFSRAHYDNISHYHVITHYETAVYIDTKFSSYTVALSKRARRKKYLSPAPESWCKRQVCSEASKWAIERGSY